jgi:hypothetical protein
VRRDVGLGLGVAAVGAAVAAPYYCRRPACGYYPCPPAISRPSVRTLVFRCFWSLGVEYEAAGKECAQTTNVTG